MNTKYAVALMKGEEEVILGIFGTKEEADFFGRRNPHPHSDGLQYCFKSAFKNDKPVGNNIKIYNYYNV